MNTKTVLDSRHIILSIGQVSKYEMVFMAHLTFVVFYEGHSISQQLRQESLNCKIIYPHNFRLRRLHIPKGFRTLYKIKNGHISDKFCYILNRNCKSQSSKNEDKNKERKRVKPQNRPRQRRRPTILALIIRIFLPVQV